MKKTYLTVGLISFVVLVSCASAFQYKWYGIDPNNQLLLGPTPAEDKPLSTCAPDELQKGKCAVFLIDEFDRLRNDYITLRERLKKCEGQQ